MIRKFLILYVLLLFLSPAPLSAQDKSNLKRFETSKKLMGVKFGFIVYAKDLKQAETGITAALQRIAELEKIMSDYDPHSEVMRLTRNVKANSRTQVSSDLLEVLQISSQISRLSDGAFDPTVGHLSSLWRSARQTKTVPQEDKLSNALDVTGWKMFKVHSDESAVSFCKTGMRFDFGGIAKGYAADEAIAALAKAGITRCLIDASGDITVADAPPGRTGWRIAISHSQGQIVNVTHASVATSGDRFQYLDLNGKRYSHIIDPKTGWGVTDRRLVTVVSKAQKRPGTYADAWASALSVMPMKTAVPLMEKMKPDYSFKIQSVVNQSDKQSVKTLYQSGCLKQQDEQRETQAHN